MCQSRGNLMGRLTDRLLRRWEMIPTGIHETDTFGLSHSSERSFVRWVDGHLSRMKQKSPFLLPRVVGLYLYASVLLRS